MKPFPVIFVVGPTAVGKSDFAEKAATRFSGQLLNCDSVQSYSRVQIGAAKPTPEVRQKIPHLLWDWVHPPEELTASKFRAKALDALSDATQKGPVLAVGGSGFYLRALQKGLYPVREIPAERHEIWRTKLTEEGPLSLYQLLKQQDPLYAARLSPNDGYRIARALELIENEGRTLTEIQSEFEKQASPWPYRSAKIGLMLNRAELIERIRRRTNKMMNEGLVEEVQALVKEGLESWAPLKSVGYKEVVEGLKIGASRQQMEEQICLHTAQLAKKQMTWFKGDSEVQWFEAEALWQAPLQALSEICGED